MNDVFSLFEDEAVDANAFDTVKEESAQTLSSLIRQSLDYVTGIEEAEKLIKNLKALKKVIDEEKIPALMVDMGVESLTVDGNKVSIERMIQASILSDNKLEAFSYLRSIGAGDLIKNEVVVQFGMGKDNVAKALFNDLEQQGLEPRQKEYIHPQSLRRWTREMLEEGHDINRDLINVYDAPRAVIKRGK